MATDDRHAHCLLTTAEMAAADRAAIEAGTPGIELMEAAGAAVAREIRLRWRPRPAAILCGPGNNGGDGFVVGRLLVEAGWPVSVLHAPQPERLRGDARTAFERWVAAAGVDGRIAATSVWQDGAVGSADLIVAALFGAGLARPVDGRAAQLSIAAAARAQAAGVPVIAVDVPSGVDGNTGACLGPVVPAQLTVTFFRPKPGHYLLPAAPKCGALAVRDIGIAETVLDAVAPQCAVNAPALWRHVLRPASPDDHKYTRGHVLVVAGEMPGASILAARAAARSGAGMVTVAWFPDDNAVAPPVLHAQLPASILKRPLADAEEMAQFCNERRVGTLLAGQGFGRSADKRNRLTEICALPVPCILDADALFSVVSTMAGKPGKRDTSAVLPPQAGEFARIESAGGGGIENNAEDGKVERTRRAAVRWQATIVHKGYDTVIAGPDGRAVIGSNGSPNLATAGSGDVLAGTIAGLRVQGMPAFEAACAAVWCHGEAAARSGRGMLADDLPDRLPDAMAAAFG